MEARIIRLGLAIVLLCGLTQTASAQVFRQQPREFVAHSPNFVVFASSPQWAAQVAQAAEQHRRDLAIHWLGAELPAWPQRCPIRVNSGPQLGAQGETRYSLLSGGRAGEWMMSVEGTPERVLDSVLPHEITHTIFASHFAPLGKYVPRWADEGACTTVEHEQEKRKHREHLHKFLKTGRGLAFNTMFKLKEYPSDILPLYAQGHSAVQFLIDQGGAQKFVKFLEAGMQTEDWANQLAEFYEYESIGDFQTLWNKWLADGSPSDLLAYAPSLRPAGEATATLAAASLPSFQGGDNTRVAIGTTDPAPVILAGSVREVEGPNGSTTPMTLPSDPVSLQVAADFPNASDNASTALAAGSAMQIKPADGEGWYKRRLREVSGSPATPVPEHNTVAKNGFDGQAGPRMSASSYPGMPAGASQLRPQAMSRPMPSQSTGIQVLDWGSHAPVSGIQTPIHR